MSYIETKIMNAFIIVLIVILIIMLMLFYFNYQPYIVVYGERVDEYVDVFLTDKEISKLNNKLKYKDEIIDYKIVEIGDEYIIHNNEFKRKLKLDFNYDEYDYILELYLGLGEETNVWGYLYEKYMKGVI